MKYELPLEPEGPVWDCEGHQHTKDRDGLWSVGEGSWGELLAAYGPLTDEGPRRGKLTLVETKDRRNYVVVPLWDEDFLLVVLPNEKAGDIIDVTDVVSVATLVALPPEHIGDYKAAARWLSNSKTLQPAAIADKEREV